MDRESGLCYVYNNKVVEPGWSGFGVYQDEAAAELHFWNNWVVDAGYYGAAGYGLWWSPVSSTDSPDLYFRNCTIVDSDTDGVWLGAGAGTVEVHDCIVVGSGSSDINNNDTGSYVQDNQTGTTASQYFMDAANNDFRLTGASPARENSSERKTHDYDYDNAKRPYGTKEDQGAYEYHKYRNLKFVGARR
jgi:hypothetical protein